MKYDLCPPGEGLSIERPRPGTVVHARVGGNTWPSCMTKPAEATARWYERSLGRAISLGATPCPDCFNQGGTRWKAQA